jgi:hypothetical protein
MNERSKFKPAQAGRAPKRRGQGPRSPTRRLPHFFLAWALGSGADLAGRDSPEARMQFGAASQGPECAPDLRIDIRCESGLRRCERQTLTSSPRMPKATGFGLWMTRPSDNPKCRPQRSRIQCESSQFGRQASCPRHNTCRLKDPLETLVLATFLRFTLRTGDALNLWPILRCSGTSAAPRRYPSSSSAGDAESVPTRRYRAGPENAWQRFPSPRGR